MPVCKFFLSGNCKFGDKCRFEHPSAARSMSGSSQSSNQNKFNPLLNGRTITTTQDLATMDLGPPWHLNPLPGQLELILEQPDSKFCKSQPCGSQNLMKLDRYGVTRKTLEDELTLERPIWLLSAFGPGLNPPVQLFEGFPLEQSPEEIRLQHYEAVANGKAEESAANEQQLALLANTQVNAALNDLGAAIKYIMDGADKHPNRVDQCINMTSATRERRNDGVFSREARSRAARYNIDNKQGARGRNNNPFGQSNPPFGRAPEAASAGVQLKFPQPAGFEGQARIGAQTQQFGQPAFQPPGPFGQTLPASDTINSLQQLENGQQIGFAQPFQQNQQPGFVQSLNPVQLNGNGPTFGAPSQQADSQQYGQNQQSSYGQGPTQPQNNALGGTNLAPSTDFLQQPGHPTSSFAQPGLVSQQYGASQHPAQQIANNMYNNGGQQPGRTFSGLNDAFQQNIQQDNGSLRNMQDGLQNGGTATSSFVNGATGEQSSEEVAKMYEYMRQNDSFPAGVMPEIAPKPEWCNW